MSLTSRDRKILAVLIALALLAGYWFLLLKPKMDEAREAADRLAEAEERRDTAFATLADLQAAKDGFSGDYATVVRLGKAIPSTVDVPSLMVQLQEAARGTDIAFDGIAAGEREESPAPSAAAPPGGAAPPTDPASASPTAPPPDGTVPESASPTPASGTTAPPPADSAAPTAAPESPASGATDPAATPVLESVPLDFEFRGSFFHLADFFHQMKRFVHLNGGRIEVSGRLMTLDSVIIETDENLFPQLKAEVSATVYVAPEAQGTTAGATPEGPAPAPPATEQATSSGAPTQPPAASVTP